ncbi:uncharacterized protein JCM10292_007364 [Rhodotorula paludigena]|uniref:uncharacterized protein n=1 Tax=Rhodotorula paludigena TaxID=86838 RepID=UPI003170A930
MAPSPGPARAPSSSSSSPHMGPRRTSHPPAATGAHAGSALLSTTETSTSDSDGDALDDGEVLLHAGAPGTWVQQSGEGASAPAGGRRRSLSLAERPGALSGRAVQRSASDWTAPPSAHSNGSAALPARRRGSSSSSAAEDDDGGVHKHPHPQPHPPRLRSRAGSFSSGVTRRRPPSSSTATSATRQQPQQLHPFVDVSPFSRPPSAVTAPYTASRPGSARPSSAATQRRYAATAAQSWGGGLEEEQEDAVMLDAEQRQRPAPDAKGKGREVDESFPALPAAPQPVVSNDPLDPLYALQQSTSHATLPPSASMQFPPTRASSVTSANRVGASIVRPQGPSPPALRPPDPFAYATPQHRFPTSYPSTESLGSSSLGLSSAASASSSRARGSEEHQPSLQQILKTVDLGAALKLVQTLQQQQQQQQRIASTVANGTAAGSAVPAAGAVREPISPAGPTSPAGRQQSFPPSSTVIDFGAIPPPSPAPVPSPQSPSFSSAMGGSAAPPSPLPDDSASKDRVTANGSARRDRRLSVMGGLQKRLRTSSSVSKVSSGTAESASLAPPKGRERERVPDERAIMGDAERSFEEQVSRVHLHLSPATLRRAQNCAKYLSLRYTPLYAALSAPDHSIPLPNPLAVARWRIERDEADKRTRRQQLERGVGPRFRHMRHNSRMGGAAAGDSQQGNPALDDGGGDFGSGGRLSTLGSIKTGATPSPYGPRRNKQPGVWEVYPDDVADYVAMGGKATLAEAAAADDGASSAGGTGAGAAGGQQDPMATVRQHKRGSMSIDQLFRTSTRSSTTGSRSTKAPTSIAEEEPERDETVSQDLSHVPTGASAPRPASEGRSPPNLGNGTSSTRSLPRTIDEAGGTFALRSASPTQMSPPKRPVQPRQTSYEGAPLSRSKASFNGSDTAAFPGSPLRRSTSLSHGVSSPEPRSPAELPGSQTRPQTGTVGSEGSPYARVASAQASRDDLSTTIASGSTGRHRHTGSTTEGLRAGLSRRFDRIRGRTNDDAAESNDALGASVGAPSDSDTQAVRIPYGRHALPQLNGNASDSSRGRPLPRKHYTSFDFRPPNGFESDGLVRSSGDETGPGLSAQSGGLGNGAFRRASRGILQSAWQGFKTSLDAYPDPYSHPPASRSFVHLAASGNPALRGAMPARSGDEGAPLERSRIAEADEESEDDAPRRPPREVVDLPEDDLSRLNSTLRQLRSEVGHFDESLPQQFVSLGNYVDELASHAKATTQAARLKTTYEAPRLPASVLAEIAWIKERHLDDVREPDTGSGSETDTESESSSPSTASSYGSRSTRSSAHSRRRPNGTGRAASRPGRRRPLERNSDRLLRAHTRRVTDPISPKPQGRARAQTLAMPPSGVNTQSALERPVTPGRSSGFSPVQHADPLAVLGNVVRELTREADKLEAQVKEVVDEQDAVDGKINELVREVEQANKNIEANDFPKLRNVEDHLVRLSTSLARPSPFMDTLSATMAPFLFFIFYATRFFYFICRVFYWIFRHTPLYPVYRLVIWLARQSHRLPFWASFPIVGALVFVLVARP